MKRYSKEFKGKALKLSNEIGVKKAAAQLGVEYYTIADWRRHRKADIEKAHPMSDAEQKSRFVSLSANAPSFGRRMRYYGCPRFFAKDRKK